MLRLWDMTVQSTVLEWLKNVGDYSYKYHVVGGGGGGGGGKLEEHHYLI